MGWSPIPCGGPRLKPIVSLVNNTPFSPWLVDPTYVEAAHGQKQSGKHTSLLGYKMQIPQMFNTVFFTARPGLCYIPYLEALERGAGSGSGAREREIEQMLGRCVALSSRCPEKDCIPLK